MKKLIIGLVTVLMLVSAFALSTSAAVSGTRMTSVMEGAVEYNGNYYRLIKETRSWEAAKLYCEGMGGHLATISDEEEDLICRQLWKASGEWDCWLGASDAVLEGSWQWVTGEPWVYSNFNASEPNGDTGENYLGYYHSDGTWNDDSLTAGSFICEWEAETLEKTRRFGYVSSAEMVYDRSFYFDGHLYKVFDKSKNFEEAKAYCEQLGGHLATITSPEEQAVIYMYLNYRGTNECMLGGGDVNEEGTWEWFTGEPFGYSSWAVDEPNDWLGEDYIRIFSNQLGRWNDVDWGGAYLCEWDDRCLRTDATVGEHTYGEWQSVNAATCTSQGQNRRVCSGCGKEETQAIPLLPHTFDDWSVTKAPTCLSEGKRERNCTVCMRAPESEQIAILPHPYGEWRVVREATCTEVGARARVCASCMGTEEQVIEVKEHTYGEYVAVSGNAIAPPIVMERTCAVCHGAESYEDWGLIWVPILVIVGTIGVGIGVVSYVRAFKKH